MELNKIKSSMGKKGQLQQLTPAIISLVLGAVVLVVGLVIVQEVRDTQLVGTEAFEAGNQTLVGLGTFGDFWEIIVLAVVALVVIGLLLGAFGGATRRR